MYKKLSYLLLILIYIVFNAQLVHANNITNSDVNWIEGPKTVDVGSDLAKLDLPEEYLFANGEDAKKLMEKIDNSSTGKEQGIVFPKDNSQNWYVLFEFDPIGYVSDSESKKINADKLLEEIKEGTEKDNEERKKKGSPTLDIIGWDEKPHYDEKTHNLVWSILADDGEGKIVNYNVRILGRGGVTEITLVAGKDEIEGLKPKLESIVSKYSYKEGKKYTDYIKGDKVSELGLTALIAGGAGAAASKVGILAMIKKILIVGLLALKKVFILIIVAIGASFKKISRLFKKKSSDSEEDTSNVKLDNLINTNIETPREISEVSYDLEKKKD